MRILACSANMYPPFRSSGIGNVIYNVVAQLRNSNEIDVCVPVGGDIKLLNEKLIIKFIDILNKHAGISVIYLNIIFWYRTKKYIIKNHENYDVFWLHNPHPIFFTDVNKAIITMHSTHYGNLQKKQYLSFVKRLYYKLLNPFEKPFFNNPTLKFTVVSQTVYNELKQLGVDDSRLTYINNGVDISTFKPIENKFRLRNKFNFPIDNKILISVGRLVDVKQPDTLVEIFHKIQNKLNNVSLVIVGDGYLYAKIKKKVQDGNIKNVFFMGFIDGIDKIELYACSDYYIMTSKYEGQPLTLLEAMSSGLPCIVSDIPNLRIVEEANCGIVVDFSDKEKATNKIIDYVIQDNSKHGKNARLYIEQNSDWKIIADKYMDLMRSII